MFNCPVYAVLRHWSLGYEFTAITLYLDKADAEAFAAYLEASESKAEGEVVTLVEVRA